MNLIDVDVCLTSDLWQASLEDTYESLSVGSRYHSPSQSYLQIHKPTAPAQVTHTSNPVRFTVTTSCAVTSTSSFLLQVGTPLLLTVESSFNASHYYYTVSNATCRPPVQHVTVP